MAINDRHTTLEFETDTYCDFCGEENRVEPIVTMKTWDENYEDEYQFFSYHISCLTNTISELQNKPTEKIERIKPCN